MWTVTIYDKTSYTQRGSRNFKYMYEAEEFADAYDSKKFLVEVDFCNEDEKK